MENGLMRFQKTEPDDTFTDKFMSEKAKKVHS